MTFLRFTRILRVAKPLGIEDTVKKVQKFSFAEFFNETNFWTKFNTGPFWIGLLFVPTVYGGFKSFYWTREFRQIEKREVLADRFAWLHERMLEDEVDKALLESAGAQGLKKNGPALSLGPDVI